MTRILLAFAVLFCAALGAFFLFVPPLIIATGLLAMVILPLTGFMLLYLFGVRVELQPAPPPDDTHQKG